jgi:hypothetical protein
VTLAAKGQRQTGLSQVSYVDVGTPVGPSWVTEIDVGAERPGDVPWRQHSRAADHSGSCLRSSGGDTVVSTDTLLRAGQTLVSRRHEHLWRHAGHHS